ncbi:MAG TPA: dienelactone hydrolase family protein [Anaerolineae bacterium]|nr:dienelactone hydrolase family protein [Anaerolineae bacterium]
MTIETRMIEFPINAHNAPGYLAQPGDGQAHPGIVVIQEWWGLVPHIKDVAERFAREGFVALAPDLYHGQAADEPDKARKLAMALDAQRAVQEIAAAARYLKKLQNVAPQKVGVVGWCMGGGLSLSTAAHHADLIGAAVAFYGRPLTAGDTAKLQMPVLGLYAEHDHGIPLEAVHAFEAEMDKGQVPHEVHIYPGTSHAFFNDTRPQIYQAAAAQDAWQKTLAWFRKYLVNG